MNSFRGVWYSCLQVLHVGYVLLQCGRGEEEEEERYSVTRRGPFFHRGQCLVIIWSSCSRGQYSEGLWEGEGSALWQWEIDSLIQIAWGVNCNGGLHVNRHLPYSSKQKSASVFILAWFRLEDFSNKERQEYFRPEGKIPANNSRACMWDTHFDNTRLHKQENCTKHQNGLQSMRIPPHKFLWKDITERNFNDAIRWINKRLLLSRVEIVVAFVASYTLSLWPVLRYRPLICSVTQLIFSKHHRK